MIVSSTPLLRRRRMKDENSSPNVSPIRKKPDDRLRPLPKLPKGTTLTLLRAPPSNGVRSPLANNYHILNVMNNECNKIPSSVSRTTRVSSAHLISNPTLRRNSKKRKSQLFEMLSSAGLNPMCLTEVESSKQRQSRLLDIMLSCDEEPKPAPVVHPPKEARKTFFQSVSRNLGSETHKLSLDVKPISESGVISTKNGCFDPEPPVNTKKRPRKSSEKQRRRNQEHDEYEFLSDTKQNPQTEMTKYSLAETNTWKEMKDQPGVFFSKHNLAQVNITNNEAFPARAGYLKITVKTKLEVLLCSNNIVFTVVKGKGHMKNKSDLKNNSPKVEMLVGDIFTAPQGSSFSFVNLASKNDLVLSYVKLI